MGSRRYPYKGVLDIIANRCLASGTNAYTDQDHTLYELTTAGSSGFLKVLPIYLDHLLQPTLTVRAAGLFFVLHNQRVVLVLNTLVAHFIATFGVKV